MVIKMVIIKNKKYCKYCFILILTLQINMVIINGYNKNTVNIF